MSDDQGSERTGQSARGAARAATGGYLCLVLHAHLPFVRHPEHPVFLEESWLFEAMLEAYIPLLDMLDGLREDDVDFRLGLSLSPPLCEMLTDELLQERFSRRLSALIELMEKELERTAGEPEFHRAAEHYYGRFRRVQSLFHEVYQRDLVGAFRKLQDAGKVEIICCAATHAFLPLLGRPGAVQAQLRMGIRNYISHFGREPRGMWIPECAYVSGLDQLLAAENIRYFFLDSHGVLFAKPRPKYGTFAPVYTPSHVAVFGRDIESSKQVWSAQTGYPGDPLYREFYRDLGYDAEPDYIGTELLPEGVRHDIGIKYHRVTGDVPLAEKEPYNPETARARAHEHAANFLSNRQAQARHVYELTGRPPLVVTPYDAELFGHWWYEGPEFLNRLLRRLAADPGGIRLVTPSEYLAENPTLQVVQPSASSWGDKGYFEVWLNGANDWTYRHLHKAEERMVALATAQLSAGHAQDHPAGSSTSLTERALNQAARELMLAQSSDWAFILTTRTVVPYATRRIREHLLRFNELHEMLTHGAIDAARLADLEARDNIFPDMDFRVYA